MITIDLAESDAAYREKVRAQLSEPYRTMLGHFRHEVGHYDELKDETAAEQGLAAVRPEAFTRFRDLVAGVWIPLSTALNQINRSMGSDDRYPFAIPAPVLDKLDFVAALPR